MKTIGIIGAMDEEISYLKPRMEIVATKEMVGLTFYIGRFNKKNIILVRSGIGKVNAAICAQSLINLFGVDYIINIGVAGAICKDLNIGDIVISKDALYHDFDVSLLGDPKGVIPRMESSIFPADEDLVKTAYNCAQSIEGIHHAHIGRICSGDQFVASNEVKNNIWSTFKGYCVEMEGAAIAHVCYLNHLPFVVIRAISDKADDSAHMNFDRFLKEAAKNSSDLVEKIIDAF